MGVSLLTPFAGILAISALLPLAVLLGRDRRAREIRAALSLGHPSRAGRASVALSLALVPALLGLAATQPVLDDTLTRSERTDAQAFFVLDTSRSMLASTSLEAPTRFDRAKRDAGAIRADLREVPSGIASLTDRLLPHAFPTDDEGVFGAVLDRVVGIDKPPPATFNVTATTLGSLSALANRNFFTREVRQRVAIVFTDAESRPFASASVGRVFRRSPGIRLVFVRYGNADERVFTLDGGTESGYRPDPDAPAIARSLAQAAAGEVFDEGSIGDVGDTVRGMVGQGETKVDDDDRREIPLAPYSVALAFLPLGLLLWRRNL